MGCSSSTGVMLDPCRPAANPTLLGELRFGEKLISPTSAKLSMHIEDDLVANALAQSVIDSFDVVGSVDINLAARDDSIGDNHTLAREWTADANGVNQEAVELIDKDMPRTHLEDAVLRENTIPMARELLLRLVIEDVELGYCQGLNIVAMSFASRFPAAEAGRRFFTVVHDLRGLWLTGMPLYHEGQVLFIRHAQQRPWFLHLEAHGVETTMYLPQAWFGLFGALLPQNAMKSCLEFIETQGLIGVVAMTLAILDCMETELQQQKTLEDLLKTLHGQSMKLQSLSGESLTGFAQWMLPYMERTSEIASL